MAAERILVVDDEEGIRRLLVRLCSLEGYQVETAVDKASACQALEAGFFNICISDLRLPDANGIEVLRYAKRLYPDCEVIILTGYGDLQTAIEALRLGAYDYLQKPLFDLQLILIVISRALERQRLARHNANLLADLQVANRELEFRRRRELQYIHYIGRALAGALDCREVAQVLVQGLLESTGCDGSGVLLLARDDVEAPLAITDGKISLPLIHDVQVVGLTPLQLQEELTGKLSQYVENPTVSVIVQTINSLKIFVIGNVNRPGVFDAKREINIVQAIAMAGGFTEWANKRKITIFRKYGGTEQVIKVNYNKIVSGAHPELNIPLQPGDTINVP